MFDKIRGAIGAGMPGMDMRAKAGAMQDRAGFAKPGAPPAPGAPPQAGAGMGGMAQGGNAIAQALMKRWSGGMQPMNDKFAGQQQDAMQEMGETTPMMKNMGAPMDPNASGPLTPPMTTFPSAPPAPMPPARPMGMMDRAKAMQQGQGLAGQAFGRRPMGTQGGSWLQNILSRRR